MSQVFGDFLTPKEFLFFMLIVTNGVFIAFVTRIFNINIAFFLILSVITCYSYISHTGQLIRQAIAFSLFLFVTTIHCRKYFFIVSILAVSIHSMFIPLIITYYGGRLFFNKVKNYKIGPLIYIVAIPLILIFDIDLFIQIKSIALKYNISSLSAFMYMKTDGMSSTISYLAYLVLPFAIYSLYISGKNGDEVKFCVFNTLLLLFCFALLTRSVDPLSYRFMILYMSLYPLYIIYAIYASKLKGANIMIVLVSFLMLINFIRIQTNDSVFVLFDGYMVNFL
jgi:hypothetical protein